MTEQEQQLINAILRIDHASAPEIAMALVFGINQTVDNRLRKMAEYVKQLSLIHPEVQEITDNLNRYLAYTIKGTTDNEYGDHPIDFTARVLALLYFHPDNEQKFSDVETIGGFAPEHAEERMQQAIPIFIEGISNGKWKLKDYPRELRVDHEIIIAELGQRAESFLELNINFRADHDFQRAALGNLNIVDLIQEYKILEKEAPQYNAPGYKEYQEKRKAISADVKRSVNRGYILEYVDEELKDFEFVRDVIRNDGSALKFAGSWQKTEEILVEAILAMVRYSGLHWDFSLYYDDPLEDTLREYLDTLKEIGKNGNNAIYEKLLDGLFFEGNDKYYEGFPLKGIDEWKDKYAISWYENKALGILIYRLVLDCPADAEIHESLNWDNLCQWFIYATENVGDGIEGHDGHKHLNMVAPKEFFTSWKYIKWLFEFRWDDVPLFCVCDDYVFEMVPNDKFSDKQFLCNVLMSCSKTSAYFPESKLALIEELANDEEVSRFIKYRDVEILEKINSTADLSSSQFAEFPDIQLLKRSRSFVDVKVLKLNDCKSLMSIQNLSALDFLEELQLNGCSSLESLTGIENLSNIKKLSLNDCSNLKSLSALKPLTQLEFLYLNGCGALVTFEGLEDITEQKPPFYRILQLIDSSNNQVVFLPLELNDGEDLRSLKGLDFAMNLLKICPWFGDDPTLMFLSDSLRSNKKVVLEAVKNNVCALFEASEELQNDYEVFLEALKSDYDYVCEVTDNLKTEKELVLKALKSDYEPQNDKSFFYDLPKELLSDIDFAMDLLKICPWFGDDPTSWPTFIYLSDSLQSNKKVVLEAVKNNGYALEFTSEEFRADRQVVLEAVKQAGEALEYASEALQNNPELIALAEKTKK